MQNQQKKAEFVSRFFSGQAKPKLNTQNRTHNQMDRLDSVVRKTEVKSTLLQDGQSVNMNCGQITPKRTNCYSQPGSEKKHRKLSPKFKTQFLETI